MTPPTTPLDGGDPTPAAGTPTKFRCSNCGCWNDLPSMNERTALIPRRRAPMNDTTPFPSAALPDPEQVPESKLAPTVRMDLRDQKAGD